jgi:NADH dehydrogenase
MDNATKHVVIVGGGFGGIEAAKILGRHPSVKVTVIDRRNHYLFQPLLYQVAMAGLSPADIASPIRTLLSQNKNTRVLLGDVKRVNAAQKSVTCDFGTIDYDFLILACGANHSYFNNGAWEPFAPGLKTLEQATEIRRRVLMSFEMAEREMDAAKRKELLTFVVVGGGPTGVEISGSLGEISRFTLSRDFRNIEPTSTRVILVEAGPRILPSFSEALSRKASRDLEKLGVSIWTSTRVTNIDATGVYLDKEQVKCQTVIWAAGVKPSLLNATLGTPVDEMGRLRVEPDLSIPGHPEIFAIGDQIRFDDSRGRPIPGQAPAAMQQGRHAAHDILRVLAGQTTRSFKFLDKGQMATIGRRRAVLEYKGIRLSGAPAWWAWLFVHIYYLAGFKNRLFVMIQWAISYMTWGRGARLVTNSKWTSQ